ncbi:DUF3618 domain-containing protein, partial [Micromonospora zhanjiangensis]
MGSGNNGQGDPEALRQNIRRTRAELGETVQALAGKADVKARIKDSAAQASARVRSRAAEKTALVREQAGQTAELVRDAGRGPVPWAALA